jgi:hypothetical protein
MTPDQTSASLESIVQRGSVEALVSVLAQPAELFEAVGKGAALKPSLRFGVLTTLPPILAVALMLATGVGSGDLTQHYLTLPWTPDGPVLALCLVALGCLGIASTMLLGLVARLLLPRGSRCTPTVAVSVALFAFGVRAYSFVPGAEIPTFVVALGLAAFGLACASGASVLRASLATGIASAVAGAGHLLVVFALIELVNG